jgi:catechol 2,3-dioxygenase-like lactoylglutathione lyase family enzyme
MGATTTGIRELNLVIVPVTDQDRSIEFYVESLGLEKRTDVEFGPSYRWVEVYAPVGSTGIALATPPPGQQVTPQVTGITLATDDIETTHAALADRGVDLDAEIMRMGGGVPPMFWFRDPDGHSLIIVEVPPAD